MFAVLVNGEVADIPSGRVGLFRFYDAAADCAREIAKTWNMSGEVEQVEVTIKQKGGG
jgi:hypothetical protein